MLDGFSNLEDPGVKLSPKFFEDMAPPSKKRPGSIPWVSDLSARSSPDLAEAAGFMILAIETFPEEAESERSELLLRLALIHRLRGALSDEKLSLARATEIDASLDAVYETLIATDGTVSGPEKEILEHLRMGMITALSRGEPQPKSATEP